MLGISTELKRKRTRAPLVFFSLLLCSQERTSYPPCSVLRRGCSFRIEHPPIYTKGLVGTSSRQSPSNQWRSVRVFVPLSTRRAHGLSGDHLPSHQLRHIRKLEAPSHAITQAPNPPWLLFVGSADWRIRAIGWILVFVMQGNHHGSILGHHRPSLGLFAVKRCACGSRPRWGTSSWPIIWSL